METRPGPYRRSIQASDIDDLVALIDAYGSELICNLLVAYGYARTGLREAVPGSMTGTDDRADDVGSELGEASTPDESE
jgi:hypothetical protein